MIRFQKTNYSFQISFLVVIIFHLIILFIFKQDTHHKIPLTAPSHRINKIDFISNEDLERIKRVGIQRATKNKLNMPDFNKVERPISVPQMPSEPSSPMPKEFAKSSTGTIANAQKIQQPQNTTEEKVIALTQSHEILKQEAMKSFSFNRQGLAAQKISDFEIRYERPEGVSEDELNSDEKAFYSFYKRSYSSYVSKLYATYDELAISRPRLTKDFENKHLLVGRIDYDENGNIVMIKILKSSESDDVHFFFEETLKKLVLPNPPKIFLRKKKQFSIYYQVQIN